MKFYGRWLAILGIPLGIFAQEDEAMRLKIQEEQQEVNFDTFFYEALQQKAIGNFDKAIYALEECQDIDAENLAVMFEFSKNYFELNKYTESEYYAQKALVIDPDNLYIIRHLKEINLRQNDFEGALLAQKLIIQQKPDEESELIFIFLRAGRIDEAKEVVLKLEGEGRLPDSFDSIKQSLLQDKTQAFLEQEVEAPLPPLSNLEKLKESYEEKKDYSSLMEILENELKTKQFLELLKDSEKAVELYPAQPYVYLMHGIALNQVRKYTEAIATLNNGLEMIVEDKETEAKLMEQLSLAYKASGDKKMALEYYNKMLELRDAIDN